MEGWLDFDKIIIAQTSLEMFRSCLRLEKKKPEYRQWVYITLHSAVQGYMVLALTGSNSILTYNDKCAEKWLSCYEMKTKLPDCGLDKFMNLYQKIKSDRFLLYANTQKFEPTVSQEKSINDLNTQRNTFVHYKYGNLFIRQGNSPSQFLSDCLDFIDFLALRSNNIFWGEEKNKKNVEKLLDDCRTIIET